MVAVHLVVPDSIDDPTRPSGGNTYDRRVREGLTALGWSIHEHVVPGSWPIPDAAARAGLAAVIAGIGDGSVLLVDGVIASTVPETLVPEGRRLRLVVLVHMPVGDTSPQDGLVDAGAREQAVLAAASAIVTTSAWTRRWLLDRYALRSDRVYVAEPGVDAAALATGSATGGELLCVAAVTPNKGHDVLLAALATVMDLPWRCVCVGSVNLDPGFVGRLNRQARAHGIDDRLGFAGARTGPDLDSHYADADLLVLASRAETYGMAVTEALARGLPVVATAVGGLPDALGRAADGSRPGMLVPPGDSAAFAAALRRWLTDTELRWRLRSAARERRVMLSGWSTTSLRISRILADLAA